MMRGWRAKREKWSKRTMIDVLGHTIWQGDALAVLKTIPDNSYGACCTDPPYHLTNLQPDTVGCARCGNWGERKGQYGDARPGDPCPKCAAPMVRRRSDTHEDRNPARGYPQRDPESGEWQEETSKQNMAAAGGFMGMAWDGGDIAFNVDLWREVYRVLKPGAFLVAFSATRTYHRMATAIEDAGFVVRDMLHWSYGSGFPKRHDISKAFDKANGVKRDKTKIMYGEYDPADPQRRTVANPKAAGRGRDGREGSTRPWIERAKEIGYHEIDDDTPISAEAIE
jgi:DNA modification methylase